MHYGYLDGLPSVWNDNEAWLLGYDDKWRRLTNVAEVWTNAHVVSKEEFDKTHVPPMPKAAFQE